MYEISIIIPTYNRSELLSYTLNSLAKQNIGRDEFEVIIADDGSTDNTKEVIVDYENLINIEYVFQQDLGYRPASARNKGLAAATGTVCLFLDSGIILHPDSIRHHINFFKNNNGRKAAVGYVYGFDHSDGDEAFLKSLISPLDPKGSIERIQNYDQYKDIREKQYSKYCDNIESLPAPWFYYWTCHVSAMRSDIINVGAFDEKYDGRWGVEDQDLGLRLQQDGVKICLLRNAVSIHYPHNKNKADRHAEGYQNCQYFHSKFNTIETGIYLEVYKRPDLVDINEISLRKQNLTFNSSKCANKK